MSQPPESTVTASPLLLPPPPPPPPAPPSLSPHSPAFLVSAVGAAFSNSCPRSDDIKQLVADNLEKVLCRQNSQLVSLDAAERSEIHRRTARRLVGGALTRRHDVSMLSPVDDVTDVVTLAKDRDDVNKKPSDKEESSEKTEETSLIVSFYRDVPSVVQRGPSCGLAALCMALRALDITSPDLNSILRVAQSLQFTKQGEMFSAKNMLSLVLHVAPQQCGVLNVSSDAGSIVTELVRKNVILIPYDRDANGEPCRKSGHKAHWAFLTGVVIKLSDRDELKTVVDDMKSYNFTDDECIPNLIHATSSCNTTHTAYNDDSSCCNSAAYCNNGAVFQSDRQCKSDATEPNSSLDCQNSKSCSSSNVDYRNATEKVSSDTEYNNSDARCTCDTSDRNGANLKTADSHAKYFPAVNNGAHGKLCAKCKLRCFDDVYRTAFVYALHGRSVCSHLWSLDELLASNRQLTDVDPNIAKCTDEYLLPVGSMEEELCGRMVVLTRRRTTSILD